MTEEKKVRFIEDGHRYFIGERELPSLSHVLRKAGVLSDLSNVPPLVLDRKRRIGTSVHKAIQYLIEGRLDFSSLGDDVEGYVRAAERYLVSSGHDIESVESPEGSLDLGYCCTPDLVARTAIVEWKTTYRIMPEVAIQLAGQHRVIDGGRARIAVQLKADGTYDTHEFSDDGDFEVFDAALRIYRWKNPYRPPNKKKLEEIRSLLMSAEP